MLSCICWCFWSGAGLVQVWCMLLLGGELERWTSEMRGEREEGGGKRGCTSPTHVYNDYPKLLCIILVKPIVLVT